MYSTLPDRYSGCSTISLTPPRCLLRAALARYPATITLPFPLKYRYNATSSPLPRRHKLGMISSPSYVHPATSARYPLSPHGYLRISTSLPPSRYPTTTTLYRYHVISIPLQRPSYLNPTDCSPPPASSHLHPANSIQTTSTQLSPPATSITLPPPIYRHRTTSTQLPTHAISTRYLHPATATKLPPPHCLHLLTPPLYLHPATAT